MKKLMGYNQATLKKDIRIRDEEVFLQQRRAFDTSVDEKYFNLNVSILREFVEYFKAQGRSIVILEAQHLPSAMNDEKLRLNRVARKIFKELEREYSNVKFFGREEIYEFREEDYESYDMSHINMSAAQKYLNRLLLKYPADFL